MASEKHKLLGENRLMMVIEIDGSEFKSEADFYELISATVAPEGLCIGDLAALWQMLSARDGRRISAIVWNNSSVSRKAMPGAFKDIVKLLREVEAHDDELNVPKPERFKLLLR